MYLTTLNQEVQKFFEKGENDVRACNMGHMAGPQIEPICQSLGALGMHRI